MGGGDKGLRPLAGRPLLSHVIERIAPQVPRLSLNTNGDPEDFVRFRLEILPDPVPGRPGPLAGVLAALIWAEDLGADRVLTVPGDTPFLPGDLVPQLLLASETGGGAALAESAGRLHPVCGLWPVALRPGLTAALQAGTRRVGGWALEQGAVRVAFPSGATDPFANLNTPEDFATAEALL